MDNESDNVSVEECLRWVDRLEKFCVKFEEKGDQENAKLMKICSILMSRLAVDVECQLSSPFPIQPGDC